MTIKLMRLLVKASGWLLGAVGISTTATVPILVCVFLVLVLVWRLRYLIGFRLSMTT